MLAPQALENIPIWSPSGNFLLFLPPTKGALTFSLTYLLSEEYISISVSSIAYWCNYFYFLPADIISNGAALFPPRFPEAGVTEGEGCGKFSELQIHGLTGGLSVARKILTISLQKLLYFP